MVSLTACLHWTPSFHCYSLLIVILGPFYILWTCIVLCQVCHRHAREHTASWRQRVWISRGSVQILRNGTKKCTECLDASHQYQRLQSKQIQSLCQMYSNSISPGERLREICQKHGERKYTLQGDLLRQGCEKPHRSSAHSVWKVSTNVTPSYLNDLKSKNSFLDTEDVDTCLNKGLFCWKDLWMTISRQTVTR